MSDNRNTETGERERGREREEGVGPVVVVFSKFPGFVVSYRSLRATGVEALH